MPTIVVVEPDEEGRAAIQQLLEAAGYDVVPVENAGAALLQLEAKLPDLVVTELYMEGMDGLELIRAVRREWPLLPVVSMTLGDRPGATDTIEFARLLGANAFVQKPIRGPRLKELVEIALAS